MGWGEHLFKSHCRTCGAIYKDDVGHYCRIAEDREKKEKKEEREWIEKNQDELTIIREKRQLDCEEILREYKHLRKNARKPAELVTSLELVVTSVLVRTDYSEFTLEPLDRLPQRIKFFGPTTSIYSGEIARFYVCKAELRTARSIPDYKSYFNSLEYYDDDLPPNYSEYRFNVPEGIKGRQFLIPRANFGDTEVALRVEKIDPKDKSTLATFESSLSPSDIIHKIYS